MAVIIQSRRDTAANWTLANPILANGEIGYETDTGKIKIGDGLTNWNSLGYSSDGSPLSVKGDLYTHDGTNDVALLVGTTGQLLIADPAAANGIKWGQADHTLLTNAGANSHTDLDNHLSDNNFHFTKTSISHADLLLNGTNSHLQIDSHITDTGIHLTEGSISHANIAGVGEITHVQLDDHVGNTSQHFAQSEITITESQITDLQPYLLDITTESLNDLSDVFIPAVINDAAVLTFDDDSSMWGPAAGGSGGGGEPAFLYTSAVTTPPTGTGIDSLIIGNSNTSTTHDGAVVIGSDVWVTGIDGVGIGKTVRAGKNSVAIGPGSIAGSTNGAASIAIGELALANNFGGSIAIGRSSDAGADRSICIGQAATAATGGGEARDAVVIGTGASAIGPNAVAIGNGANAAQNEVMIGTGLDSINLKGGGQFSLLGASAQLIMPNYTTGVFPIGSTEGGVMYDSGAKALMLYDGAAWNAVGGGGGASAFIDLTGTPNTYTGSLGNVLKVGVGDNVVFDTLVLDYLSDVNAPTATGGQVLTYVDVPGEWQAVAPAVGGEPAFLYTSTVTTPPVGTGINSIVIGDGANTFNPYTSSSAVDDAIIIGLNATGSGIVIGPNTSSELGITIGENLVSTTTNETIIGDDSRLIRQTINGVFSIEGIDAQFVQPNYTTVLLPIPGDSNEGATVYDSDTKEVKVYDGTIWKPVESVNNTRDVALSNQEVLQYMSVGRWGTQTTPSTDSNTWTSVAWAPELSPPTLVAVANAGTERIMTSVDGVTWVLATNNLTTRTNESIAWSPTLLMFAAASNNAPNGISTSPDGLVWTEIAADASTTNMTVMTWLPGINMFMAGDTSDLLITSSDGIIWTSRTMPLVATPTDFAWSPSLGLAVAILGNNGVIKSLDGITWTSTTVPAGNLWESVTWSKELGFFLAVSSSGTGNRIMTSLDGDTWTSGTSPADNEWMQVEWSGDLKVFVAVARTGAGDRVMTSSDGVSWVTRTSPDAGWNDLIWVPELAKFISVSTDDADTQSILTNIIEV